MENDKKESAEDMLRTVSEEILAAYVPPTEEMILEAINSIKIKRCGFVIHRRPW